MRFSYSSLRKWLTCERAWSFAYVDRLRPIRQQSYFNVGKYGHALLEHALRGHALTGTPYVLDRETAKAVHANLVASENIQLDEVEAITTLAAARETITWMRLDEWSTVILPDGQPAVEIGGTVPWRGHELEFRIDWIGKSHKTGDVWIVDHKTTRGSIDDARPTMEFDLQSTLYREAAKSLGIHVDGAMVNLIRVAKKAAPEITPKTGVLSRNKIKNAMRWTQYERAIIERGEDPADFADMREHLQARRWNMWRPDRTSEHGRAALLDEAEHALQRMREHTTEDGQYFTLASRLTGACERCEFEAVCSYGLDGNSITPLLGVAYEPRDEASPWFDRDEPSEAGLADYFARQAQTGRFDATDFRP